MKPTHSVQQLWGPVYPLGSRENMENLCTNPDFLPHHLAPLGLLGREPALIIRVDLHQAKGLSKCSEASPSDFGNPETSIHLTLADQHHCQGPFTLFCSCRPGQARNKRSHSEEVMGKRGSFLPVTGDGEASAQSEPESSLKRP